MDKRNELVKEWIHKADHDMGMAKLGLEHKIESILIQYVFIVNKRLRNI